MSKIKILVVPSDRTGVGYYRSTVPHINLQKLFPDDVHVDIDYDPQYKNDKWLKQYDIIHYHRTFGPFEEIDETMATLERLGIPSIMDLDDHWAPGQHHPAYRIIKENKLDEKLSKNLRAADNITTTTSVFAQEMKKFSKNVFVIPNAIDPKEKQYTPDPKPSERIRIGWLGGSSHLKDLEILSGLVGKLKSDGYIDKIQFVLCGYDLRGQMTIFDQKTGEQTQRAIKPEESVWFKYEQIFTDNYSIVSDEYKKHLLSFKQIEYSDVDNEPYRRVWTKPITSYASNYNLFDISLAPLEENLFNKVKSQLKVIEAGFHKKALIAQDFGPYQIDVTTLFGHPKKGENTLPINEGANGFLIPSRKNHKLWFKYVKYLIDNPEKIKEMGEKLYDTVNGEYDMQSVCKKRLDLYRQLITEKQSQLVVS
jgi:glycosyltransferase involved in cell wall biosynthesis|tara:strand:+ start:605 stop:1873 length:1269 start_codon:yes stop_codon:yes gene_type:complete